MPRLTTKQRNEARRLITLIDAMYESGTKLVAWGEVGPEDLFEAFMNEH